MKSSKNLTIDETPEDDGRVSQVCACVSDEECGSLKLFGWSPILIVKWVSSISRTNSELVNLTHKSVKQIYDLFVWANSSTGQFTPRPNGFLFCYASRDIRRALQSVSL